MRLFRVRGKSMSPALQPGDLVWLSRRAPRKGDVVVVNHPRFGTVVKRLGADGRLSGDGAGSTDADRLGRLTDCALIGVARLAVTPRGVFRL